MTEGCLGRPGLSAAADAPPPALLSQVVIVFPPKAESRGQRIRISLGDRTHARVHVGCLWPSSCPLSHISRSSCGSAGSGFNSLYSDDLWPQVRTLCVSLCSGASDAVRTVGVHLPVTRSRPLLAEMPPRTHLESAGEVQRMGCAGASSPAPTFGPGAREGRAAPGNRGGRGRRLVPGLGPCRWCGLTMGAATVPPHVGWPPRAQAGPGPGPA